MGVRRELGTSAVAVCTPYGHLSILKELLTHKETLGESRRDDVNPEDVGALSFPGSGHHRTMAVHLPRLQHCGVPLVNRQPGTSQENKRKKNALGPQIG